MFIRRIELDKDNINIKEYPYTIESIRNLKKLEFNKPVSFFIGENGSGKSTLIEAIAINCGLNKEGGSQNYMFTTKDTCSNLSESLKIIKGFENPKTKYFLRAESFYNVCSYIETIPEALGAVGGESLHNFSHGESFLKLVENKFHDHGLYILDEPESALSIVMQLRLLYLIDELVKNGSQFIIATHSPILLSYKNSEIFDFNNNLEKVEYKDTEIYQLYKLFIDDPDKMLNKLLNN